MKRRLTHLALGLLLMASIALVSQAFTAPAVAAACSVSQGSAGCCSCNVKRWQVTTCCPGNPCHTDTYCLWGTCCGPGPCCA